MATVEKNIGSVTDAAVGPLGDGFVSALLKVACSVRVGIVLLCAVVVVCFIGMVVMQQNVEGFQSYFATLTPAQRSIYSTLGFFNIYHSWYFKALLSLLAINIILASIDRFPRAWLYISQPQVVVPVRWLCEQGHTATVTLDEPVENMVAFVEAGLRKNGWRTTRQAVKSGRRYLMAESGAWNRLGAYAVHTGLLIILFGGFLSSQMSTGGQLELAPGKSTDLIRQNVVDLNNLSVVTKRLPFEITFNDIEQKLIDWNGPLSTTNTLDWITRFTITDVGQAHEAVVSLNQPFDYRGYRFFQADFSQTGRARKIRIEIERGGKIEQFQLDRGATERMSDGASIKFADFHADFGSGMTKTVEFRNPVAVLEITPVSAEPQTVRAFANSSRERPTRSTSGYTARLIDYEKVADTHILSVQRDPGSGVVYLGFGLLTISLMAVFFFSHERVWAVIEEDNGQTSILTAGNTNRNEERFRIKFERFANELRGLESGSIHPADLRSKDNT